MVQSYISEILNSEIVRAVQTLRLMLFRDKNGCSFFRSETQDEEVVGFYIATAQNIVSSYLRSSLYHSTSAILQVLKRQNLASNGHADLSLDKPLKVADSANVQIDIEGMKFPVWRVDTDLGRGNLRDKVQS